MFMSTVVYFVEFVVMSLVGIMSYKLYASYVRWKDSSASTSSTSETSARFSPQEQNLDCIKVTKINVNLIRNEGRELVAQATLKDASKKTPHQLEGLETNVLEKKPSAILNDYIGDFFSDQQTVAIGPDRNAEVIGCLGEQESQTDSDDEFIRVESLYIVPEPSRQVLNHLLTFPQAESSKKHLPADELVPTLNEFCDLDTDTYITVVATNDEAENTHKTMSDKVVRAMLDEAKLVRVS